MSPTYATVRELLNYDPETGDFTWAVTRRNAKAGARAGAAQTNGSGYRVMSICDHPYLQHRVAFLWMTGAWPTQQIDHINGVRDDNRWANLREVSPAVNQQNKRAATHRSVLGLLGASPPQGNGRRRFKSTIQHQGRSIHLGYHDTPEQAHAAYVIAKRQLHEGNTL